MDIENQIEGESNSYEIYPSAPPQEPPVYYINHYHNNRGGSFLVYDYDVSQNSPTFESTYLLDEEEIQEDDIDICVLYLCAVIAFIIPWAGLCYLFYCRFCWGNYHRSGPKKKRAYKILLIGTLLGFIVDIIIVLIFET
jgi:hypothetical protein